MSTLATATLSSDDEDTDFVLPIAKSKTKRKATSKPNSNRKGKAAGSTLKRSRKAKKASGAGEAAGADSESGAESDSATSSSSSGSEDGEDDRGDEDERLREAKRVKMEDEVAERRRKAREEFERMKAELNGGGPSTSAGFPGSTIEQDEGPKQGQEKKVAKMVDVKRARRFAGETVHEVVSLPVDDPEAIAFLADQTVHGAGAGVGADAGAGAGLATGPEVPSSTSGIPSSETINQVIPVSTSTSISTSKPDTIADSGQSAELPTPSITSSATASTSAQPQRQPQLQVKPKGAVRRKPRQSLEAMSAALDKGKKMTTLEKSQMDWKSHTSSTSGMSDELNANRRNGGYLEKKDFLDRVGERRTGTFDSNVGRR